MVNTEEFTNRLHQVMKHYELSAASFADKIEVGRSSISHLLSGRNKPSLDFVLKIVNAFPDVELYWLLNGKGSFPPEKKTFAPTAPKPQDLFSAKKEITEPPIKVGGKKGIKKIVIFYEDGSFEAFEN